MENKSIGTALFVSAGLGLAAIVFESGGSVGVADGLYTLAGMGLYVFGVWAAFRLKK